MKVLAVGAHPDDIEILCGGTLFLYRRQGHDIELLITTDGSGGRKSRVEMKSTRRKEAEAAADMLGTPLHWLDERDEFLFVENFGIRDSMAALICQIRPDVILTHDPGDYHPDHRATSKLVFDASFVASVDNADPDRVSHDQVPALFYFDTLAGVGFRPEVYVDVSDTFNEKAKMLEVHKSQLEWLHRHDNVDIQEFIEVVARFRGLQAGVEYAEAFRREMAWPRGSSRRLLP